MGRKRRTDNTISLQDVMRVPAGAGVERVVLDTDRGTISGFLHAAGARGEIGPAAVVWVGGAGGGTEGPAGGLYRNLAERLAPHGISSLRLDYRHPNVLVECITDVLVGLAWLEDGGGVRRAAVVGHSFGGAVVIDAGALSPIVKDVIALSSQTYGADLVAEVSPRTLLLVHGDADRVLPAQCSRQLYAAAQDPRELVIYPGAGHGLDECAPELHDLLYDHLRGQLEHGLDEAR
ncbi:MAG TPA: dienelactone hydrolase family protein [Chloroflexia bacterium]|nr:dienelactone hydrolase family protein [Chloroflexia bacterium]